MSFLKEILLFFLLHTLVKCLPPLPEAWSLEIEKAIKGNIQENWLSDYTFLAPVRVKPGNAWNATVEATWTGPSLLDPSLLNYLKLKFTPIKVEYSSLWSGDRILVVKSYNHSNKQLIFHPNNSENFMIASKKRLGVYNDMHFTLQVGDQFIPNMFVFINTRFSRDVEVTCSDGIFCNGEERYVLVGSTKKCMNAKLSPCDDPAGNPCSSYKCDEANKECSAMPIGGEPCRKCNSSLIDFSAVCKELNLKCGLNANKTINCGSCEQGKICSKNECIDPSSLGLGSCGKPYLLYNINRTIPSNGLPAFSVMGDLSSPNYVDHVAPVCNPAPVPDIVYEFEINSQVPMGIEVQMLSADGSTDVMDTVLALTNETCDPLPIYSFCGDDNVPPGGVSSRIFGKLTNGIYKLIATAFSDSETNLGPFELKVKFYPDCLPQCEGNRKCGPDGCGGFCGECQNEQVCHLETGLCRSEPCIPDCTYMVKENVTERRECGDDGCGGICGSCNVLKSEMCVFETGKCIQVQICDHLLPVCVDSPPKNMENAYCGHDCEWHSMSEPLGDLIPNNKSLVLPSVEFNWVNVPNRSCAIIEGCHKQTGDRLLMRFDTYVHNTGRVNFYPPSAPESPHLFEWSPCHAHFHFDGFALFNLYDMNHRLVSVGGKRGYCMEDTVQTIFGNHIPCHNKFDCSNQGIQPGWADLYPNVLDCQWLDITEVEKEKWYIYEICSNVDRKLQEASNTNDCKRFPVFVPEVKFDLFSPALKYHDELKKRNLTLEPEIALEPGERLSFEQIIKIDDQNNENQNIINILFSFISNLIRNFVNKIIFF